MLIQYTIPKVLWAKKITKIEFDINNKSPIFSMSKTSK